MNDFKKLRPASEFPFKVGDFVVINEGKNKDFEYRITHISHGIYFCGKEIPGGGWAGHCLEFAAIHDSPLMKALK